MNKPSIILIFFNGKLVCSSKFIHGLPHSFIESHRAEYGQGEPAEG